MKKDMSTTFTGEDGKTYRICRVCRSVKELNDENYLTATNREGRRYTRLECRMCEGWHQTRRYAEEQAKRLRKNLRDVIDDAPYQAALMMMRQEPMILANIARRNPELFKECKRKYIRDQWEILKEKCRRAGRGRRYNIEPLFDLVARQMGLMPTSTESPVAAIGLDFSPSNNDQHQQAS